MSTTIKDKEDIMDALTTEEDIDKLLYDEETEEPVNLSDTVQAYMRSIAKYPVLTKEEEQELFRILQDGQSTEEEKKQAYERIYTCNLKLVVSIARHFSSHNPAVEFMDIIQEGNIGISKAISRFEPSKGFKFSTYATWWIRQNISRELMSTNHFIRVPIHEGIILAKVARERAKYITDHNGKLPTKKELAKLTGFTVQTIETALMVEQNADVASLYSPTGEEEDGYLMDLLEDKNAADPTDTVIRDDFRKTIDEILAKSRLSDRDKEIFYLRTGWNGDEPITLQEIGEMYGVSRERIRQIETKVYRVLRSPKNLAKLKAYRDLI